MIRKIIAHKKGATAIEYALVATLISVTVIAAVQFMGKTVSNTMSKAASSMV